MIYLAQSKFMIDPGNRPKRDITFRLADRSDATALVPLINRAFEVELQFFTAAKIDLVETLRHFEKGKFLIAEDGDVLTGCNYVELRGEVGYFGLLSVEPAYQGRGLGSRLIKQAEEMCRSAGCSRMQIRVLNHRTELPPFYEKLNYRVPVPNKSIPSPPPVFRIISSLWKRTSVNLTRVLTDLTQLPAFSILLSKSNFFS